VNERIMADIASNAFYQDNFPNNGQRFVAWYLHRVLMLDVHQTKAAITDGADDKQIDAIVVEDGEDRRIRVIQGKFVKPESIDAAPLREGAVQAKRSTKRNASDCRAAFARESSTSKAPKRRSGDMGDKLAAMSLRRVHSVTQFVSQ
jgi:hypothetical protein